MSPQLLYLVVINFVGVFWLQNSFVKSESVYYVELTTQWTLTNQNSSIIKSNVRLPSGVYSALYGDDVLNSYNDVGMRWISYDNWTYTRSFSVDLDDLRHVGYVNLTFHGIDTVAEIRLNRDFVGRTDNMFVRYSYDVTKLLQEENFLEIEIKSPVYAARAKANALEDIDMAVPPSCPNRRYNGECHMNMLRKMQASFSWDWGLAAPSMGIWKPVTLEYYEIALIRDIDIVISKNSTHWLMHVRVFIDVAGRKDFYAKLTFYAVELLDNSVITYDYSKKPISAKAPIIQFDQAIPIDQVRPWWPNGNGDQKLYPLHFTLNAWRGTASPELRSKTISQKSLHVGFRTIELMEQTTGNGNTFLFRVNGEEIFMKGTNYIPIHILPEYGNNETRIKHLLQSVKDANMNMIRVWGGGIYEHDYFYNLADEYGILVWQDMMFACAMYPVTDDFLASVRTEVIQNAKRLSHHPSIAIIATNNENEVALAQNWYSTNRNKSRFESEYRELYLATVMHELKIVDHSGRPKPLVSSPSNGKESAKDNYLSNDPQNPNYGDVHFYDVTKDAWNPGIYPRPRFSSEYGFQSLPSLESWKRSMSPENDILDLISHREHHPLGLIPVTTLVRRHLPLPLPEDENYAEALIYFSQIAQAMATKVETEFYRSLRDTEHRTMGALYWQLNDVWVAPSWSSIDYYGNYKLLHHWAKDFMAPIALFALYDETSKAVNVTLACDKIRVNTTNLQVSMNIYKWSELFWQRSTTWPVTLKPNGVQYDKVIKTSDIFVNGLTEKNSLVEFILQSGPQVISRNYYFPSPIKAVEGIRDPEVKLEVTTSYCQTGNEINMNSFSLAISVTHPAVFVYVEIVHPDIVQYKLTRNGFMQLVPVQIVHLEFQHERCLNLTRHHVKILTVNQFMK